MTRDCRVMIADDDPDVQLILSRKLARHGFAVTSAWNGAEVLDHLAEGAVDVAIVDVRMPGVSGLQTLLQIQELRPDLLSRVVVFTGATEETRAHIAGLPVFAVIGKADGEEVLIRSVIQCAREAAESCLRLPTEVERSH